MTLQQLEREMVAQPIRSLQYMLNRLSLRYDFLPALVPDGVFGERHPGGGDALPAGAPPPCHRRGGP